MTESNGDSQKGKLVSSFSAPKDAMMDEVDDSVDPMARTNTIRDRENDYQQRRFNRELSPERADPFAEGKAGGSSTAYQERMQVQTLEREKADLQRQLADQQKRKAEIERETGQKVVVESVDVAKKRRRWDVTAEDDDDAMSEASTVPAGASDWETESTSSRASSVRTAVARSSRWDQTPSAPVGGSSISSGASTPSGSAAKTRRWDQTPTHGERERDSDATPVGKLAATAETPFGMMGVETPMVTGATPLHAGMATPDLSQLTRAEREMMERNRYLSDEELETMFPKEGYYIVQPPETYVPVRTPARKLMATPTPMGGSGGSQTPLYQIPEEMEREREREMLDIPQLPNLEGLDLPELKPEDYQYFAPILQPDQPDESTLTPEEIKERKVMRLLLKIKNGAPQQRKVALRHITDKARDLGAASLFNQILPLLMSPTLEDMERHLLVKVIDRVLYKLDDLVRPYTHKILVVIAPLLIDEDYYARVEGREIISNLAKAAGLATMIATMRPDIDNVDEYVRNTTARAFAVVASALGIPALLPFLKAVCQSRKSWQARHTGIKIVQQIAVLIGSGILPHLRGLVDTIEGGLTDEQQKVRTITALAVAGLAEAAHPYGIESFDNVLVPLWKGVRQLHGKGLAAFLKAIGCIIPLMDAEYATYYTKQVMVILIREFATTDEEMKKIVLKVVKQCVSTEGVDAEYVRSEIIPEFFNQYWAKLGRRNALDRRNLQAVVETTLEIAEKVGGSEVISRIVEFLKDEAEALRKMTIECIRQVVEKLGALDVDQRLEERLLDGIIYAFQEQTTDDTAVLQGFGAIVNALGTRVRVYLPQMAAVIKWRLNNKSARVRQQSADLIGTIAQVIYDCEELKLLGHLGVVLYEYLGEEYPDVLGSILAGLKAVVRVMPVAEMTPPMKDLLPRLTPILKNRHEKVAENCVELVGIIADKAGDMIAPKEWMRICFDLLDQMKALRKSIRNKTIKAFGFIARAIGPQDVLAALLNNLKVQERQNRVCTTIAIAAVAEKCAPFTVIPALMCEYRVPELNVQNGVLKSLAFLFEYIGELSRDYVYAVVTLLEDALMERDLVHRQTACTVVKHLALGCAFHNREDAVRHLMNLMWPNIFEKAPHMKIAFSDAVEGIRVALGPSAILLHLLQGLFHPARKVRDAYWKCYNLLYIGAADALVPTFPRIPDTQRNVYARAELDIVL